MKKQQGNALAVTVIVILAIGILGTLAFLFHQNFIVKNDTVDKTSQPAPTERENTPLTKEFRSKDHNIAFNYPEDWSVAEQVEDGNTAEWYASVVKVLDAQGKETAHLATGGQIGGLCSEDAPLIPISTIIKDPLELKGIGKTNFGYTIIETAANNYGIAFGLLKDDLPFGNDSVKCPGMSVNYRYYVTSETKALGGITFGLWYAEAQQEGDPSAHQIFKSLDEAKAYAQSDEFKKIMEMIKSLSIGG